MVPEVKETGASQVAGGGGGQGAQFTPPQSVPVSEPFLTPSLQVGRAVVILMMSEVSFRPQLS